MFIASVLLLLASILPLQSREEIDQARFQAYDYLDQDQLDSAIMVMDQAIYAAKKMDYDYGTGKSIFVQSYLYRIDNQLGKSFELNLKALKILESSDDDRTPETLAQIYLNTGEILINHFKYHEAIKYFNHGLEISHTHNLQKQIQDLSYNLGFAFKRAEAYEQAIRNFQLSLVIAEDQSDEWMFLNSHNMLGKVAIQFERYEEAREHFQKIINHTFEQESSDEYIGMAYENIGETFFLEKRIDDARNAFLKALLHDVSLSDSTQLFNTQLALVELHLSRKDLNQAWHYGKQAVKSYEHTILSPDNYRLFDLLTSIAFQQNQYTRAQDFHRKYIEENEAFIQAQKETLELSEQYKMEMLTASFFKDIEKQEQMAQLNSIIYFLLGLGLLSLVFVRAKKYLLKKSLEQAFREVAQKKNLHF